MLAGAHVQEPITIPKAVISAFEAHGLPTFTQENGRIVLAAHADEVTPTRTMVPRRCRGRLHTRSIPLQILPGAGEGPWANIYLACPSSTQTALAAPERPCDGRERFRGGSLGVLSAPWVLELPFYDATWISGQGLASLDLPVCRAPRHGRRCCHPLLHAVHRARSSRPRGRHSCRDLFKSKLRVLRDRSAARPPGTDGCDHPVPLSLLAAVLSSNWLIFLGILIVPVVGPSRSVRALL